MKQYNIKCLEFALNIITRMNTNSFQVKSSAIKIVSALFSIYSSIKNYDFILIAIFPLTVFCFLDSYYLHQEQKFREIYNEIIKGQEIKLKPLEMRLNLFNKGKFSFLIYSFQRQFYYRI